MKAWQKISTITFSLVAAAAMIFLCVFFFAPKTSTSPESNPSHAADTLPTTNWVDYAVEPAVGSGTEADPWHISTAEELAYLAKTASSSRGFYLYLDADIDLGAHLWTPIGDATKRIYSINFDGLNHTIKNLYINTSVSGAGLIGGIMLKSQITNLTFENVNITSTVPTNSDSKVGVVVGMALNTTFDNVNVKSGLVTGNFKYVGGIAGYCNNTCTINNCTNGADITGHYLYVGGIAGYFFDSSMKNCKNTGAVYGEKGSIGGIVGDCYTSTIKDCKNEGIVTGINGARITGGIVGVSHVDSSIENCFNTGDVKAETIVGGIVGGCYDSILSNCVNRATITGTTDVGPIVGKKGTSVTPINCINVEGLWTDYAVQPAVGSGTQADPWHIYTAEELAYLAKIATSSSNFYLYLEADIDLLAHEWVPIGKTAISNRVQKVVVDGKGHVIDNMYIVSATSGAGLFGGVENNCMISNLKFADVAINCQSSDIGAAVGFAGNGGEFTKIDVLSGEIKGKSGYVGGIVGRCVNGSYADIRNCTNNAVIKAEDGASGGGIVGVASYLYIINCVNTGNISVKGISGGIVGQINYGCDIRNCLNLAEVNAGTGDTAGGIVGGAFSQREPFLNIESCYNEGNVTAWSIAGGIVGGLAISEDGDIMEISKCFSKGSITINDAAGGMGVGGLVGWMDTSLSETIFEISNCEFCGSICSKSTQLKGPIIGVANIDVKCSSCFYDATLINIKTGEQTVKKEYILGADESEATAFSPNVWSYDSRDFSQPLYIRSLMWSQKQVAVPMRLISRLKNRGFTQAA